MSDNQKYIDGSWYDEEYRYKWYRHQYIDTPEPTWAKESKDYYIGLMIAYTGLTPDMSVLDLGSGVGQAIQAWERRGFTKLNGIEISQTAVDASNDDRIKVGSVKDLPFMDKEFDVVTSFALFEHIDESIIHRVLCEAVRVGRRQIHNIGLDKGSDPSHINIKTPEEWMQYFGKAMDKDRALIASLPDPFFELSPILVGLYEEDIPHPLLDAFKANNDRGIKNITSSY